MKILLRHQKVYPASFMSHLDVLRGFIRTMRRAGFPVAFSKGFTPHMQIFPNQPLPLGVESLAEYTSIELTEDIDPKEFLDRYNLAAPISMRADYAYISDLSPASDVEGSEYLVRLTPNRALLDEVARIRDAESCEITYEMKGKSVTRDVRALIKDISVTDEGLRLTVSSGNENLRPDRLMGHLSAVTGVDWFIGDVVRLEQLVGGKPITKLSE